MAISTRKATANAAGETPLRWSADGKALFVAERRGAALRVHRVDVSTGRMTLWREFAASDPAGVLGSPKVLLTPDGNSYVYAYWRDLSDLYLIDGLR